MLGKPHAPPAQSVPCSAMKNLLLTLNHPFVPFQAASRRSAHVRSQRSRKVASLSKGIIVIKKLPLPVFMISLRNSYPVKKRCVCRIASPAATKTSQVQVYQRKWSTGGVSLICVTCFAVSLNIKDLFRVTSALQDNLVEPGTVSFILLAGGVGKRMGVRAAPKFNSRML